MASGVGHPWAALPTAAEAPWDVSSGYWSGAALSPCWPSSACMFEVVYLAFTYILPS